MGKVIYEKKFPKQDWLGEAETEQNCMAAEHSAFLDKTVTVASILEWKARNTVYILIPRRQKVVRQFIRTAIRISEENRIDIKIMRNFECVTVSLMFEAQPAMSYLKEVIRYADNINFFANVNGYEIIISLDCYTHAVYRHGIQLYP